MFDVAPTELLLVALVALVVIGPKDLPKAMRFVGYWVGRARSVMRQFRSGFDSMVREAELEEMEKKWAAENARIMAEHPAPAMLPHASDTPAVVEHDDGEAAPVMVEQPAFAPDPPPPPALPAPVQGEMALPDTASPVATAESGEGEPVPAKKPRKPKAAS
ncbi:Sec-independent protein translocase protein TatB [Sphingomonas sp. PB4P5]|uniref:Sec-independent protein translocase protein TatB n=1 Tax=Parasphingomonas puruogangriensis TaxID=3096155 RepID=UPI002FC883F1